MMRFKQMVGVVLGTGVLLAASVVGAQDTMDVVVDGLNYPRAISFDTDGNLYIAEAGVGGELTMMVRDSEATAGNTAAVVMVMADGTRQNVIPNMPSLLAGPEATGVSGIQVTEESYWILTAQGHPSFPLTASLIELDRTTMRMKTYVDLAAYEAANNPDGNEIDSNPNDLNLAPDGTIYIVDTGANTVYMWTADAGLSVFHTWTDNPVPTSVDVTAAGDVYVGFLAAGLAPGAAKIEHWSAAGELVETFAGMTTVTDVMVTEDGTVYAVQLISEFGEQGPNMESGAVGTVTADGFAPIAEGLMLPYALAETADGDIYVTTGAAFGAPGSGTVVNLGGM